MKLRVNDSDVDLRTEKMLIWVAMMKIWLDYEASLDWEAKIKSKSSKNLLNFQFEDLKIFSVIFEKISVFKYKNSLKKTFQASAAKVSRHQHLPALINWSQPR